MFKLVCFDSTCYNEKQTYVYDNNINFLFDNKITFATYLYDNK